MATLVHESQVTVPIPPAGIAELVAEIHRQPGRLQGEVELVEPGRAVCVMRSPVGLPHRVEYDFVQSQVDAVTILIRQAYALPDALDAFRLADGTEYLRTAAGTLHDSIARAVRRAITQDVRAHVDMECDVAIQPDLAESILQVVFEAPADSDRHVIERTEGGERPGAIRLHLSPAGRGTRIQIHVTDTLRLPLNAPAPIAEATDLLRHRMTNLLSDLGPVIAVRPLGECPAGEPEVAVPALAPAAEAGRAIPLRAWFGGLE